MSEESVRQMLRLFFAKKEKQIDNRLYYSYNTVKEKLYYIDNTVES